MKTTKMITTLVILMTITGFTASAQQNKDAKKARQNINESKQDLKEAKKDSAADFEQFKKEAGAKISNNQKKIAELKAKKVGESDATKEKYDQKVIALEKKNAKLKSRIAQCDNCKSSKWTEFKKQFNDDVDEVAVDIEKMFNEK